MSQHPSSNGDHSGHHIVPFRTLLIVFASLIALTTLTWLTATYVDIGRLNVPLAIAIACVKAFLVVLFFMALKYDARMNALILSVGVLFVLIFISFTGMDVFFRDMIDPVEDGTIWDQEAADALLMERDSLIQPLLEENPVAPGTAADTTGTE